MSIGDIIAVLRAMDTHAADIRTIGGTWSEVFSGTVTFVAPDGCRLVVFNDCDSWDYVDAVYDPNGGCMWRFPDDYNKDLIDPVVDFRPVNIATFMNAPEQGSPRVTR